MKKIILFILICVILLSSCSVENNPFESFDIKTEIIENKQTDETEIIDTRMLDEEKKADVRMEQIISAIKDDDKEILKSLFSKKALDEAEDFDNRIDYLFKFLDGDINSWERDVGVGASRKTGYDVESLMIRFSIIISTDKDDYLIFVIDYDTDTENPDNEGIYMLQIMKLAHRNHDWGEWHERLCAGIYKPDNVDIPPKNNLEPQSDIMRAIGERIKQLSYVEGIDEPIILVNGYSITKKEYEAKKIFSEIEIPLSSKEIIDSLIRTNVIKSEASRLGIEPSQKEFNYHLEQNRNSIKNRIWGTDVEFAYMEGAGITPEEYISEAEQQAYILFQEWAFKDFVEQKFPNKSYEKHVDELVKKADIKILDDEILKIYNS